MSRDELDELKRLVTVAVAAWRGTPPAQASNGHSPPTLPPAGASLRRLDAAGAAGTEN